MECDKNFEENLNKLNDIVEIVRDIYEASHNGLENEELNKEH